MIKMYYYYYSKTSSKVFSKYLSITFPLPMLLSLNILIDDFQDYFTLRIVSSEIVTLATLSFLILPQLKVFYQNQVFLDLIFSLKLLIISTLFFILNHFI